MEPAYLESRTVLPRDLGVILALVLAATWIFMLAYKFIYYPAMSDVAVICTGVVFVIGCLICFLFRFTTAIYDDRIDVRYGFFKVSIPLDRIIDTRKGELNIIKNYSDWTLKGVRYKTYSAIGEDMGIGLKVMGKRVYYLSTNDADAMFDLLPKDQKEE